MSYIKVLLAGKERALKFNQLSIEVFTANINYEATETSSIYSIFFAGLTGNCFAKREEVDFTFEQVCDWVDDLFDKDQAKIKEVCNLFTETNAYKNWFENFSEKVRSLTNKETLDKSKKKRPVKI